MLKLIYSRIMILPLLQVSNLLQINVVRKIWGLKKTSIYQIIKHHKFLYKPNRYNIISI